MKVLDDRNYVEVTCPGCGSLLEVHEGDLAFHEIHKRSSSLTATCGACGRTVDIPEDRVPRSWMERIAPPDA